MNRERRDEILLIAQSTLRASARRRRILRTCAIATGGASATVAIALLVLLVWAPMWSTRATTPEASGTSVADATAASEPTPEPRPQVASESAPESAVDPPRLVVEIVRSAAPSPGLVTIVDDEELASLLESLEEPVGLVMIDGDTRIVSRAANAGG